jgi:D-alanyl-D-alanine carboxypeptidase (penicillin-binding protein 5/6)
MSRERAARLRAARRRGRQRLAVIVLLLFGATFLTLSLVGSSGSGSKVSGASDQSDPRPAVVATLTLRSSMASSVLIPGSLAPLPFPGLGESAVVIGGIGLMGATENERSVPVASLTKIMTAYLVLKDHPLAGRSGGPVFVMTAADHAAWIQASEADESNIEVKSGERLDERQLLQALMIPSADNIADYLAVWDAGSEKAFVAKMNAVAAALQLPGTHFADDSGVNPGSRSTAVGMARLAALAMESPVLRSIVDEQFIDLPVSGEIWNNYDPAVGVDGIIGVKSGFTDAAGTNLVTAAWRRVGGHRVLVVCVVIGQQDSLSGDAGENETLLDAATRDLRLSTVVRSQAVVGEAQTGWNHDRSVVRLAATAAVVAWPGLVLSPEVVPAPTPRSTPTHGWPAGCTIGNLELQYPYGAQVGEPVVLQSAIGPPPAGWAPAGVVH